MCSVHQLDLKVLLFFFKTNFYLYFLFTISAVSANSYFEQLQRVLEHSQQALYDYLEGFTRSWRKVTKTGVYQALYSFTNLVCQNLSPNLSKQKVLPNALFLF